MRSGKWKAPRLIPTAQENSLYNKGQIWSYHGGIGKIILSWHGAYGYKEDGSYQKQILVPQSLHNIVGNYITFQQGWGRFNSELELNWNWTKMGGIGISIWNWKFSREWNWNWNWHFGRAELANSIFNFTNSYLLPCSVTSFTYTRWNVHSSFLTLAKCELPGIISNTAGPIVPPTVLQTTWSMQKLWRFKAEWFVYSYFVLSRTW